MVILRELLILFRDTEKSSYPSNGILPHILFESVSPVGIITLTSSSNTQTLNETLIQRTSQQWTTVLFFMCSS